MFTRVRICLGTQSVLHCRGKQSPQSRLMSARYGFLLSTLFIRKPRSYEETSTCTYNKQKEMNSCCHILVKLHGSLSILKRNDSRDRLRTLWKKNHWIRNSSKCLKFLIIVDINMSQLSIIPTKLIILVSCQFHVKNWNYWIILVYVLKLITALLTPWIIFPHWNIREMES